MLRCFGSDSRDKLLFALSRLLDSLVDVLATLPGSDGIENTMRDELTAKLGGLLKGSADDEDMFASRTVRLVMLYFPSNTPHSNTLDPLPRQVLAMRGV